MSAEKYAEYLFLVQILGTEFDEAAAGRWLPVDEMYAHFRQAMKRCFKNRGYDVGHRYQDVVEFYINEMLNRGFIIKEGDEFTGEYLRFSPNTKDTFVKNALDAHDVAKRISRLGEAALDRALAALAASEGFSPVDDSGIAPQTQDDIDPDEVLSGLQNLVPGSDRVVSRKDNLQKVQSVEEELRSLRSTLQQDNVVGSEIGDEREVIDLELEIAEQVVQRPRFRLKSLLAWLLPALRYLSEKFAGGAIAETAKRLIALLLDFI